MTTAATLARRGATGLLLAALLALSGCATVAQYNPRDPLEPFNRSMDTFNDRIDSMFLRPVAIVYKDHVHPVIRTGVSNFFGNLGDAWSFVNSALQLKIPDAAENFLRFGVNTTFGVGGLFDLASDMNIERHREDFGQTLGHWGVPAGPYLVLPFFGPSTVRDTVAMTVDRRYDLVRQVDPTAARNAVNGLRLLNTRATLLRVGYALEEAALDRYSFTRDAFLQRRRAEVYERDGDPRLNPPVLPEGGVVPAAPGASAPEAPAR